MKEYKIIAEKQREWISKIEQISIRPVMVSQVQQDGKTPSVRYYASEHDYWHPFQYRRCLDNELFFDIDEKDWDMLRIYCEPLLKYLKEQKIPYILAGSGGNGVHLSIFFDAIDYQKMCGFKEVRLALWNYILNEVGIDEGLRGEGLPYCNAVVNFGDTVQFGKILREFGGTKNGKRKTVIDEIPFRRGAIYETPCRFPDHIDVWKVPIGILESLELKTRHPKYPLKCDICPVDRMFVYEQSHYIDDWGEFKVKINPCSDCSGVDLE